MTQSYQVTTTPTNLKTQLSLEPDESYSIQVVGAMPIFYYEGSTAPATSVQAHCLASGSWPRITIDGGNPPWVWTGNDTSTIVVTPAP